MPFKIARGGISDHGQLSGLADDDHSIYSLVDSGTYTGNSSQNRAITHALGRVPKQVLIISSIGNFHILTNTQLVQHLANSLNTQTMTAWTNTVFYVGGPASGYEGNITGRPFTWVAFG